MWNFRGACFWPWNPTFWSKVTFEFLNDTGGGGPPVQEIFLKNTTFLSASLRHLFHVNITIGRVLGKFWKSLIRGSFWPIFPVKNPKIKTLWRSLSIFKIHISLLGFGFLTNLGVVVGFLGVAKYLKVQLQTANETLQKAPQLIMSLWYKLGWYCGMIILNNHHKQSYAVEENREFLQYHGKFNDDILYTQNVFEMTILKAVWASLWGNLSLLE